MVIGVSNQPTTTDKHELPKIIVVGAGLAGLAISLGLANSGKFQIDVVEVRTNFDRTGATFGLGPHGAKALEELDPGDEGVMSTLKQLGIYVQDVDKKAYMLAWWMVRNTLLERVKSKSDVIRLHMGYTLKEIVDDAAASKVQAIFVPSAERLEEHGDDDSTHNHGTEINELKLEGSLVVGADGVHSSIRTFLKCPPAQKVGSTVWRGSIVVDPTNARTTDDRAQHELLVPLLTKGIMPLGGFRFFGPTIVSVFNFHSKLPGRMNWSVSSTVTDILDKSHPWKVALEPFVDNEDIRNIIQAVLNISIKDDVCHPAEFCVVKPPDQDGEGWGGKGRVILIGDAAHAMRASTGQGGSMSFEDSVILCRALTEIDPPNLDNFDTMSDLVLRVENTRLTRVRRVWKVEQLMAERGYNLNPKSENPWTPEHVEWLYEGV